VVARGPNHRRARHQCATRRRRIPPVEGIPRARRRRKRAVRRIVGHTLRRGHRRTAALRVKGYRVRVRSEIRGNRDIGGHVGVLARSSQQSVTPTHKVVPRVRHRRDHRSAAPVGYCLWSCSGDCPARARIVGQRVRVNREVRRHRDVGRDIGFLPGRRQQAVAPVHKVIPRIRHRRDRRSVGTVVDRLRRRAGDRPARPRIVGQRVRVNREVRRHRDVGRDVGVLPGRRQQAVAPIHKVIPCVRHRRDRRSVGPVVDRLRRRAGNRPARPRVVGQRVRVNREVRRHRDVGRNIGFLAGRRQQAVAPVHKVVPRVRHRRDRCSAATVVDRLRRRAGNRPTGSRIVGQGKGLDRVIRNERHVRRNIGDCQGIVGGIGRGAEGPSVEGVADRAVCGNGRAVASRTHGLGRRPGYGGPRRAVGLEVDRVGRQGDRGHPYIPVALPYAVRIGTHLVGILTAGFPAYRVGIGGNSVAQRHPVAVTGDLYVRKGNIIQRKAVGRKEAAPTVGPFKVCNESQDTRVTGNDPHRIKCRIIDGAQGP